MGTEAKRSVAWKTGITSVDKDVGRNRRMVFAAMCFTP